MVSHFLPRIASRIRFLVSTIIQREVADPRLGLVTVLKVEPSPDMKEARVHLSIFGSAADRSKAMRALEGARGYIQREVARNLQTRSMPRLTFILDDAADMVSRIETLVECAKEEQDSAMAKKPGKKDVQPSKESAKPAKSPEAQPKAEAPKGRASKSDAASEAKPTKPGRPSRASKASADNRSESGQAKKGFLPENLPDDDEEKEFVDEFEAQPEGIEEEEESDDDFDDEDEGFEEEEEEEEEEESY